MTRKRAKPASREGSGPRPTPEAVRTPPYGFCVPRQSAIVHADPWSSGECRLTFWTVVPEEHRSSASCLIVSGESAFDALASKKLGESQPPSFLVSPSGVILIFVPCHQVALFPWHCHSNTQRHLISRKTLRQFRAEATEQWRQAAAAA